MHVVDIIFLVCWVAFWLYWLAAAAGAKSGKTRWGQFACVRVVIIVAVLLLVRTRVFKGHERTTTSPLLQGVGLTLFFLGLGLAIWARVYLGRNWGMPMSRKDDAELITTGPYRFIRNPIYSGIILAMIGTTIGVNLYWLVAVALIGAYFIYSAVIEARDMAGRFPDTYPDYKRSTKMLIPFIL
ncbi:MAG TPA: isoprenylcysteine carboxylmethyltransferase family protein [Streptosporangiaceae bacterium]|jgi:protein-S-isoprenylcysteine O-methyltransferase Ste14